MSGDDKVTPSSGNVFADMGLDEPDELLIKADLAISIAAIIQKKNLNQTAAAKLLGIDQPKVSRLVRGDLYGFSIEQLIRLLGLLGHKVNVTVEAAKPPRKRVSPSKRAARAA